MDRIKKMEWPGPKPKKDEVWEPTQEELDDLPF